MLSLRSEPPSRHRKFRMYSKTRTTSGMRATQAVTILVITIERPDPGCILPALVQASCEWPAWATMMIMTMSILRMQATAQKMMAAVDDRGMMAAAQDLAELRGDPQAPGDPRLPAAAGDGSASAPELSVRLSISRSSCLPQEQQAHGAARTRR